MQIAPILAALRRHRVATFLIALEIALACAVLCNACFLIVNRIQSMQMVSGVDESALAFIAVDGYAPKRAADLNARMVAGLSALEGVKAVGIINTVPFDGRAAMNGVTTDPNRQHYDHTVNTYLGDPASLHMLGLRLLAGRLPTQDEYRPIVDSFVPKDSLVLVTRSLADALWPGQDALGKEFWCVDFHFRVIGVVDHLAIPQPEGRGPGRGDYSVFVPVLPQDQLAGTYLIQAAPQDMPRVYREAMMAVPKIAPEVVYDHQDSGIIGDLRRLYFRSDRAMIEILLGVILALTLVTALGIVGLASFWVQQRRRQIGIRRAIGATRADILRYFQTENFLIVSMGIVIGVVLAYALNLLLMKTYEVTHLPAAYLLISAVALWVLGQFAVLGPALRAAGVPPVVATRSG
ncbi:MAG TPA: FtsX-like permease family protein [Dyella sp.]|uniref:ABC transporter permease n=1 Tax=Dyella sp. TaxID=1869338 RepID=UPI002B57C80F|nr:FtsX-like permease family protein [Dyella sp.]HTV87013.1 FtsX-like permease family protein [Dyella sp.]